MKEIFKTKKGSITCSELIINDFARSPTRSGNVCFANNEQASIAVFTASFCFTHAEHHLKSDSPLPKNIFFICFNDSPSMMKNTFYFILKALFVLKIFKFLSWLFAHVEKTAWLERKDTFEIYDVTAWLTMNYNTHIAQYLTN